MSEESPWSSLGSNVLGGNRVEELKALVQSIHVELMGSVEALGRRVGALETSFTDFDAKMNLLIKAVDRLETLPLGPNTANTMNEQTVDNVLMFMSPDELGISRTAEELEPVDDGVEVISVKGFVAPPPAPASDEKAGLPSEAVECADAILKFISENGGIHSNHWKTRNLIDSSVDAETRKEIKARLADKGVKFHKVNRFAEWCYVGEEDGEQHYLKHNG